ncbi:hypothetical protein BC832DRAFT_556072 [Gaertneriomyces semiglobifer]|nr:hypothetical protein BC832DRAFT_556072 [Gaertneriomyces semiglobifer]
MRTRRMAAIAALHDEIGIAQAAERENGLAFASDEAKIRARKYGTVEERDKSVRRRNGSWSLKLKKNVVGVSETEAASDVKSSEPMPRLRELPRLWKRSDKDWKEFLSGLLAKASKEYTNVASSVDSQQGSKGLMELEFVRITQALGIPRFFNRVFWRRCVESQPSWVAASTEAVNPESQGNKAKGLYNGQVVALEDIEGLLSNIKPPKSGPSFQNLAFILLADSATHIHPDSLRLVLMDLVDNHPGLRFLASQEIFKRRYVDTVLLRIFWDRRRNTSTALALSDFGKFYETIVKIEGEQDINLTKTVLSYKHFYVIYCKFWEMDEDHDMKVGWKEFRRGFGGEWGFGGFGGGTAGVSETMLWRVFEGWGWCDRIDDEVSTDDVTENTEKVDASDTMDVDEKASATGERAGLVRQAAFTNLDMMDIDENDEEALSWALPASIPVSRSPSPIKRSEKPRRKYMTYPQFAHFLLSLHSPTPQSTEYFFRCLDLDGDGVISLHELRTFYNSSRRHLARLSGEGFSFSDWVCTILDILHIPQSKPYIRLSNLLAPFVPRDLIFGLLFNFSAYEHHIRRCLDPVFREWDESDGLSGWDKFAERAYDELAGDDWCSDDDEQRALHLSGGDVEVEIDWNESDDSESYSEEGSLKGSGSEESLKDI